MNFKLTKTDIVKSEGDKKIKVNNIMMYYILSATRGLLLYIPILTVFFTEILKDPIKVGLLFSIKSITVFIFELPTGYISDKISRKLSLMISMVLNIISLSIFILYPKYIALIIAEIIFGISETMSSGSDSALIFDNFTSEKRLKEYDNYQRNETFIQSILLSLSFISGSMIYQYNKDLVFFITIISILISIIVLSKIIEHPYKKEVNPDGKGFLKSILQDLKYIVHIKLSLKVLLIIGAIVNALLLSVYFLVFPIVLSNNTESSFLYGIIYCLAVLVYGFGCKAHKYVTDNTNFMNVWSILIFCFLFICSYLISNDTFVLFTIIAMRFIWGIYITCFNISLNRNIDSSELRSTIWSVYSLICNLFSSLSTLVFGIIMANKNGIDNAFLFITVALIIVAVITNFVTHKNQIIEEDTE